MINLNQVFKKKLEDYSYYWSNFSGEYKSNEKLENCHICSNSKSNRQMIMKKVDDKNIAEILIHFPLLNIVQGTVRENQYYCKTSEVKYIDYTAIVIAKETLEAIPKQYINRLEKIDVIKRFMKYLKRVRTYKNHFSKIQEFQYEFQKYFNIHY